MQHSIFSFKKLAHFTCFLCLAFFLCSAKGGCKKKEMPSISKEAATTSRKVDFLIQKTAANFPKNIKSYQSKATVRLESDMQNISATAYLVWKKDEYLWLSVKKFGFEAIRAKLTPDSVHVLNRLEKSYMQRSMDWLEHEYNVPGGFDLLSHVLFGQAFFPKGMTFESSIKDSLYVLNGKDGPYASEYKLSGGTFQLESLLFAQPQASRFMGISFLERERIEKSDLPTEIQTEAFSEETNRVTFGLKIRDIELNTKRDVRFSVPKSYKRI